MAGTWGMRCVRWRASSSPSSAWLVSTTWWPYPSSDTSSSATPTWDLVTSVSRELRNWRCNISEQLSCLQQESCPGTHHSLLDLQSAPGATSTPRMGQVCHWGERDELRPLLERQERHRLQHHPLHPWLLPTSRDHHSHRHQDLVHSSWGLSFFIVQLSGWLAWLAPGHCHMSNRRLCAKEGRKAVPDGERLVPSFAYDKIIFRSWWWSLSLSYVGVHTLPRVLPESWNT